MKLINFLTTIALMSARKLHLSGSRNLIVTTPITSTPSAVRMAEPNLAQLSKQISDLRIQTIPDFRKPNLSKVLVHRITSLVSPTRDHDGTHGLVVLVNSAFTLANNRLVECNRTLAPTINTNDVRNHIL